MPIPRPPPCLTELRCGYKRASSTLSDMAGFFEAASHFDQGMGGVGPNPLSDLIDKDRFRSRPR